jgi:hypothetical protein
VSHVRRGGSDHLPPARQCGPYGGGHGMHWIQAKKASEDGEGREEGSVVETGIGWLVVRCSDGSRRRYRNRSIPWLEALLAQHGREVVVQERWGVLRVQSYLVSISRME